MGRCPVRRKPRSIAQKNHISRLNSSASDKENIGVPLLAPEPVNLAVISAFKEVKNKLQNSQRKARRLKTNQDKLRESTVVLKEQGLQSAKMIQQLQKDKEKAVAEREDAERVYHRELERQKAEIVARATERSTLVKELRKIRKRASRATSARERAMAEGKAFPIILKRIREKGVYSTITRKLARKMVLSGCPRSKVGALLRDIAAAFGIKLNRVMSPRTVSRTMLEGYIACKVQAGDEIGASDALTISADSTSNRGDNFESRHIAMRVPDYSSGSLEVDSSSVPKVRLLCVDSTVDHTSETSVKGFVGRVEEAIDFYNRSPLAQRQQSTVSLHHFLRVLKGMGGDHASAEKCTAKGIQALKREATLEVLGEESLLAKDLPSLIVYLGTWNLKKIADAGGQDAWNSLTPMEQTVRDKNLMKEIVQTLGKEEYDALPADERRILDTFIWAGCCMHKDQNSFKGGAAEMGKVWDALEQTSPILLANKANAAILRDILQPGASKGGAMTEDEQRAFENSTRGGVKTTALAGAIFNNKDDKKGQGDKHINYFKKNVNKHSRRFPPTNQTRFGSHGDAACHLIRYLDHHITYLNLIRLSKVTATFTQIEFNVLQALQDIPTLTELCAMALYQQTVSIPYIRAVRGPGTENANILDLGPLHCLVCDFVRMISMEPHILVDPDVSYTEGTLDGKPWEDADTITAIFQLMPQLPFLTEVTAAFFRGALLTWERFSSEFAPGGLIDEASADEKHLAWMPTTNDANEGALGAYRVEMRANPSMTLHQYNAAAQFKRNDTQAYMDAKFLPEDHSFCRTQAREMDGKGLEGKRCEELVQFRVDVAQIRKAKEQARKAKQLDDAARLANVTLISKVEDITDPAWKLTLPKLGEQLDALRLRGLPDIPPKSRFPKKSDRQAALRDAFVRYQALLLKEGPSLQVEIPPSVDVVIQDDWELEEDDVDEVAEAL